MRIRLLTRRQSRARLLALGTFLTLISLSAGAAVNAQQQLSKRYPGGKNVRVELRNISGTIVVESWNKNEIRLTATFESKNAHVVPKQINECLVVDVMGDNRAAATSVISISNSRSQLILPSTWKRAAATSALQISAAASYALMFLPKATSS